MELHPQLKYYLLCFAIINWSILASCDKSSKLDDEEEITQKILDYVDPNQIREFLRDLTLKPHLASTSQNDDLAKYVHDHWVNQGFDEVKYFKYNTLLSFPDFEEYNQVNIVDDTTGEIIFAASGKQLPVYAPEESDPDVPPNFNAYSRSGLVKGDIVYANYGRQDDFEWLQEQGIDLTNKIVIARYGKVFRGNIAQFAYQYNASGLILYSDPEDFAPHGRDAVYPNTFWLPGTATQSGTLLIDGGDPLTINYPSIEGAYRIKPEDADLPKIPVQPISYDDAEKILGFIGGLAPPDRWPGTLNVSYNIGPGFIDPKLKIVLDVKTKDRQANITNVIGVIRGSIEPDRYVVISNHRDAWQFGAIDPSSATATMLEVSRVFGELLKEGWRPRRTLLFASWDAEEYGLVGSTEWVEEHLKVLYDGAVVCLNIDYTTFGDFTILAFGVPILYQAIYDVAKKIPNPNPEEVALGRTTVYDTWLHGNPDFTSPISNETLPRVLSLGSGSDFATFMYLAGVPGFDYRYGDKEVLARALTSYALYHTLYDTFYSVDVLTDPGFTYHAAIAKMWAESIRTMADSTILPFNVVDYGTYIRTAFDSIKSNYEIVLQQQNMSLEYFEAAANNFVIAASQFQAYTQQIDLNDPLKVRMVNDKFMQVERAFLQPEGLKDRPTYRHIVFAPSILNSYFGFAFSSLTDLIELVKTPEDWEYVSKQLAATSYYINSAASVLKINQF